MLQVHPVVGELPPHIRLIYPELLNRHFQSVNFVLVALKLALMIIADFVELAPQLTQLVLQICNLPSFVVEQCLVVIGFHAVLADVLVLLREQLHTELLVLFLAAAKLHLQLADVVEFAAQLRLHRLQLFLHLAVLVLPGIELVSNTQQLALVNRHHRPDVGGCGARMLLDVTLQLLCQLVDELLITLQLALVGAHHRLVPADDLLVFH